MSIGAPQIVMGLVILLLVGAWAMIVNPPSSWIGKNKRR
jgi:type II secretory pathway component PulM